MKTEAKFLTLALLLIAALVTYSILRPESTHLPAPTKRPVAAPGKLIESQNYSITSTATDPQTKLVADAADSLFNAYLAFFAKTLRVDPNRQKLKLTLYRDQREFKKHNRSSSWAEAYYLPPTCYAYYADGEQNPYHWMIHEATHQLNHEVAKLPKSKWVDEGLATYFGTSKIQDGALTPGSIDANTYPIWWLPKLSLSGDLKEDIRSHKLISLRALISGVGGPNIAQNVNSYYIGYWSLTHFLFHFDNGRYSDGYRQIISSGGTIENFERLIGPVEQIQDEWYGYLRQQLEDVSHEDVVYIVDEFSTVPAQAP